MQDATPWLVERATGPLPLFDTAATRAVEAQAQAACPAHALMARAGLATARLALAVAPHARHVTVLAGPGNNGGDGLIAALHLHRQGRRVRVLHLADAQRLPPDAADAWRQARMAPIDWLTPGADLRGEDLLIDALLGVGGTRAPEGPIADAVTQANASGAPILAVDLPTGLHADSGRRLGDALVQARWTLSLLTLKPGLLTADGRDACGQLWCDALGVTPDTPAAAWLGAVRHAAPGAFAARRHGQHKGSFGDVVVIGGAPGMQGAAALAAHAALVGGAGRVYLSPLDPDARALPSAELMLRPRAWEDAGRLPTQTVVCGCGGGKAVAGALPDLLAQAGRLVLDADALNTIAADAALQRVLRQRHAAGRATVLTPHPLEAARLLGADTAAVQHDRLHAATRLADATQAAVLLKGSGSVLAAPGRVPWINGSGCARLATPGSGDVLAGWIGAALSRQSASGMEAAWLAARDAAWLHGHAADRAPLSMHLPVPAMALIDAMAAAAPGQR